MYLQVEVRNFILAKWLKNRNVPINSLEKKYKLQKKIVGRIIKTWGEGRGLERKSSKRERGPSSLKLDQKVIRGVDANSEYSVRDIEKKLVFLSRQSKKSKRDMTIRHTGSRNSLEDTNSNSAKAKNAVKNYCKKNTLRKSKVHYNET